MATRRQAAFRNCRIFRILPALYASDGPPALLFTFTSGFSEAKIAFIMGKIRLYDTTLRDGMQAEGVSFSLEDKLAIAGRLDELGLDYIEGGYAASNPKESQFFAEVANLGLRNSKIVAFGSTRRADRSVSDDRDVGMVAFGDPQLFGGFSLAGVRVAGHDRFEFLHVNEQLESEALLLIAIVAGYVIRVLRSQEALR